jgi:hypothetical protein
LIASTNKTVLTAMARQADTARSAQIRLATARMDKGIKELSTLVCQAEYAWEELSKLSLTCAKGKSHNTIKAAHRKKISFLVVMLNTIKSKSLLYEDFECN